ncbi:MAG: bifunctional methionine sulfoxide reductase B/A protein [Candidatus Aminicenantes bacterium]|nr:bifunctional methionine sulfoxide reductase B/A protein [Candidatus Aminicenantes bacterium]
MDGTAENKGKKMTYKVEKSDQEWRDILSPEQYKVLRKSGTERAFTGKYNDFYEPGLYVCAACGNPLFSSETKYDHGTGWPSFTAPVDFANVEFLDDDSLFMTRTEVRCANCGSHLGHVFKDGPPPTNMHYCINAIAMNFIPEGKAMDNKNSEKETDMNTEEQNKAVFAAGCFWGVEERFRQTRGVLSTRVGYTGGTVPDPTYSMVCSGKTGHAEAVEVIFDPSLISYEELVRKFFQFHDPTQLNRQGPDVGEQYRSSIFYLDEQQKEIAQKVKAQLEDFGSYSKSIVTEIVPASEFYEAEEYHQQYIDKLQKKKKD